MEHGDIDAVLLLYDRVADERMWIGTEPGYDRLRLAGLIAGGIDRGEGNFVAAIGGETAGAIMTFEHAEYGTMIAMLVEQRYRGIGAGRALMDAAIAWGVRRKVPELSLFVFPHNEAARRLYRATGFTEVERFPHDVTRHTGDVWDTILMRKVLAS